MRRSLLLGGVVALLASSASAGERTYIPHITKEMQSRSRVTLPTDHTRGLTLTQMRDRNARTQVPASRRSEPRDVAEQRRTLESQASSPYTAANILGMRERNATEARSRSVTVAQARQKAWEAWRQSQQDQARAALELEKEQRQRESMDPRNLRDRAGEALRAQKHEAAARLDRQRQGGRNSVYQGLSMAQRRMLNRR